MLFSWLIKTGSYIYASLNRVYIGSGNGLTSLQRQAITWTNDGLLSMGLSEKKLSEILKYCKSNIFIYENAFENIVWQSGGHLVSASTC